MLTLKNLKIAQHLSEETLAFTASLYWNGKRAGEVRNQGHGGCHFYNWSDRTLGQEIEQWADQQPTEFDFERLDQLVDRLIDDEYERQAIRRACRKKTLFRVKGDAAGEWRTVNIPWGAQALAWITKKYGDSVVSIANRDCLT